jgi:hypothetical protein
MVVGRLRVGLERAFAPGAIACLVLGAGACSAGGPSQTPTDTFGTGGSGGAGSFNLPSTGGAGVLIPIPPIIAPGPVGALPCDEGPQTAPTVFGPQVFDYARVARREFFSWTTDEQAAELRRDQVLFTRGERPGMGPGYAFEVIAQMARIESVPERAMLASLLGELFAKARFAWSEPWATRMGWPGEEYGRNLLRIVLKPEAWVAVVKDGNLTVFDQGGQSVTLADALAAPARLGMIFYEKDGFVGGPNCGGSFVSGGSGYREFILGNLAMVEEWSLGTQRIRDRLAANIAQLITFLERIRVCPVTTSVQQWNLDVCCAWQAHGGSGQELFAYQQALAIPSDNYLAVPERIAAMIETLQSDLFEVDPLIVTPGSP